MSRPAQIRFLSCFAAAYDPVARFLGFRPLWRTMAEVARPSPGQWVLDVCTGTGGAAFDLTGRGARVIGIDLAEGMLRQAQRKDRVAGIRPSPHFVQMDARDLAFRDRSFALVTCVMALHEMAEAERERVLSEIARVASDRVLIAEYRVPRHRAPNVLFRLTRMYEYVESDDFQQFVANDMAKRLERVGFTVERPRDVGAFRIWPCRLSPKIARASAESGLSGSRGH